MEQPRSFFVNLLWWTCACVGCLVCIAHFSILTLSNMPLTPLKLDHMAFISNYVNPVFQQRWNFFAPNPVDRDELLLIRASYVDHSHRIATTSMTPWINVSETFIDSVRSSRASPMNLIEIGTSNSVITFLNNLADSPDSTYEVDGKVYLKSPLNLNADHYDADFMNRIGTAVLRGAYPNLDIKNVQLAILVYVFPRYTHRFDMDDPSKGGLIYFPWQPVQQTSPFCCVTALPIEVTNSQSVSLPIEGGLSH